MHELRVRRQVLDLLATGMSRREVCRRLGVGYTTSYRWQQRPERQSAAAAACFRCAGSTPDSPEAYAYLLGHYLGDGHIRRSGRTHCLSIASCSDYPAIASVVTTAMRALLPVTVFRRGPYGGNCLYVESNSRHWLHLFPQHGPGRKHERPIVLEPWQRALVRRDPRPLIRGLIHSDGCRVINWTEHRVGDTVKRYEYPRYLFSNRSPDIRRIYTDALDQLGIAWRANLEWSISVARRDAVAALDAFVGPKS